MLLKTRHFWISLLAAASLCGCVADTEPLPVEPVALEGDRLTAAAQLARDTAETVELAAVLSPRDTEFYLSRPEELVARCRIFGVKRIFLSIVSPAALRPGSASAAEVAKLLAALNQQKIAAGLWIAERDLRCAPDSFFKHSPIFRRMYGGRGAEDDFAAGIMALNANSQLPNGLSELVVELESDKFTPSAVRRPPRLLAAWTENSYGLDGANSRIFGQSVDAIAAFAGRLGKLPTVLAVPEPILRRGMAGELAGATTAQLLQAFPAVIVLGGQSAPGDLVKAQLPHFCDPAVYPGVLLARHPAETDNGLRRRTWDDFERSAAYMAKKWRAAGARRMVLKPFGAMETLLDRMPLGKEPEK